MLDFHLQDEEVHGVGWMTKPKHEWRDAILGGAGIIAFTVILYLFAVVSFH